MSLVRNAGDERQTRVDRMIEEFRKAQSRRLAKAAAVNGDEHVGELRRDAGGQVAVTGSTTTPPARSNG